uniref:Uncharacterized protein n=1 Tax=Ciona savignyi TaxID=51511 RepID=H2YID4_CIOSA
MNVKNVARNLLRSSLIHWNSHRLGSAYRIGVKGKFEPNDHENQNDEKIYRAKVEHAVLSKAKPPLQPFEHLPKYQPPPLPNDQFLGREIPKYGSF